MKAFKAYDIRGEWGVDLNEEIAYRIGYFLHRILDVDTVLVGRDMRLSSDTMFENLTRGITDSGVNVDEIGLSTTPMVYWSTAKYGYDASVMITASHNPKNHNGLKISKTNALPVGYDTGLNQLETFVESDEVCVPVVKKGVIRHKEVKDDYLEFQRSYVGKHDNLNIAVDCSSGMSSLFVHELIGDAHYINDVLDGNFPSHEPNPLEAESQEQIKSLVKKEKCDIGLLLQIREKVVHEYPVAELLVVIGHTNIISNYSGRANLLRNYIHAVSEPFNHLRLSIKETVLIAFQDPELMFFHRNPAVREGCQHCRTVIEESGCTCLDETIPYALASDINFLAHLHCIIAGIQGPALVRSLDSNHNAAVGGQDDVS